MKSVMSSWRRALASANRSSSSSSSLASRLVSQLGELGTLKSFSSLAFLSCSNYPFVVSRSCSCFSSISSSVTKLQKHIRKNMNLYQLDKVEDALTLFNCMVRMHPLPSIVEFNRLLVAIVKMKHYGTVVSLCKQMELLGIRIDHYTHGILINCFCRLHRVDFGFSALGRSLKLGLEIGVVQFNTLINGLCAEGKVAQAVSLFGQMVELGYTPDLITYTSVLNGLCKIGNTDGAVRLLSKMKERGFQPDTVAYSTVIDSLCKDRLLTEALNLFSEMMTEGIHPNVVTYNCLIHG